MATRRNTITLNGHRGVMVVAIIAAVVAAWSGCQPTGSRMVDLALTGLLAGFVVWAAASAPWWALVVVAGVAALSAGTLVGAAVGIVAAAVALVIGSRRESMPVLRCVSATCSIQVLLRLPSRGFLGGSALIAVAAMALIVVLGVRRRRRIVRRRVMIGVGCVAGVVLVAAIGLGVAGMRARSNLTSGYRGLINGLDQLQSGDALRASQSLTESARLLNAASHEADRPWVQLAQIVPVLAQHRDLMSSVVGAAADSATAAAEALSVVDLDQLTVDNGVIDVQAVADLAVPFANLELAVTDLRSTLHSADSPWLIGPVADRLQRYANRADKVAQQAQATSAAATTGPALLGTNELRRYLVAFTSPAEARGLTGLMGNWAVITIDHGRIRRTGFGRTAELIAATESATGVVLTASDEYINRYGPFGGFGPGGFPHGKYWSNVTMSPDMPSTASVMAQMYEAGRGEHLDGVFVLDPAALAALLKATGPITVEGLATPLDSGNLEQFLLVDQYSVAEADRGDLLAAVAEATLTKVLSSSLPGPQLLARDLGPAATSGHIVAWAREPDEQHLLTLVGMNGALPALNGGDGLAVVTNNASGNKIDSFLQRTITYDATYDDSSGETTATATIELANGAPSSGYPDYVIGNIIGLPTGTNRTLLSVYSPLSFDSVTIDGTTVGATTQTELGWNVYSLSLDLAPGQTRTVTLTFRGTVATGGYSLVVRPQPLAHPDNVHIAVNGDAAVTFDGVVERRTRFGDKGTSAVR